MRLNKYIADSGFCSRREADRLIAAEAVTVNGRVVTQLGSTVDPERDQVRVNRKLLPRTRRLYLAFHKPTGVLTTRSDERGRQTIYQFLSEEHKSVDPAGRLDRESSGVLILSNDGDFIHRVTHPRFEHEKVYRVTLSRRIESPETLAKALLSGIILEPEGKKAKVKALVLEGPKTLSLTLVTGLNRQIRRTLAVLGYEVTALKRVSIGPVRLGSLPPGKVRRLNDREMRGLAPPSKLPGAPSTKERIRPSK